MDLNGWLPDFILYASKYNGGENGEEIQHKILVEVKPFSTFGEYKETQSKIDKAIKGTIWEAIDILFLGSSVFKSERIKDYLDICPDGIVGWFYQIDNMQKHEEGKSLKKIISEAYSISVSLNDGRVFDLVDCDMSSRFQGYWEHNYGASYSFDWSYRLDYDELKKLWDSAGNEVRWKKYETTSV